MFQDQIDVAKKGRELRYLVRMRVIPSIDRMTSNAETEISQKHQS